MSAYCSVCAWLMYAFACVGALSIGTLVVPWLLGCLTQRRQSLARRYPGAKWALVTGGSSGIGLSLCHKLAAQGFNLVVAAVPNDLLPKAEAELKAAHPSVTVRMVGVDLGATEPETYMAPLRAATDDIVVQCVFNNAGYVVTGFFDRTPLAKWMANYNCNTTAPIVITHHFASKMRTAGLRGCIVFTSSPANIIPSPFSSMYGATKSAITHFVTSLASELGPAGIDVCVCHPSPVATRFYDAAHALPTLNMFKGTATGPDVVAEVMLRGIGRTVIIDQGYYPFVMRLLLRIIDFTLLSDILTMLAPYVKDFKYLDAAQSTPAPAGVVASAGEPASKDTGNLSRRRSMKK